ncbi:MAG: hypothetical protein ACTS3F_09265 [Phycisphaerales bacterium]
MPAIRHIVHSTRQALAPIAAACAALVPIAHATAQNSGPIPAIILQQPAAPEMRLDGSFSDWLRIPPAAVDPSGDAEGPMDLRAVWLANRAHAIWLALEFNDDSTLFRNEAGDADMSMHITLPGDRLVTIDLARGGYWLTDSTTDDATRQPIHWDELDLRVMPSHASRRFELSFSLLRQGVEIGDIIELRFSGNDALDEPIRFRLVDSQSALTRRPVGPQAIDQSPRAAFRIASYNTDGAGLIVPTNPDRRERLARVVKAAAADIYCFQNDPTDSAETLRRRIEGIDPHSNAGEWNVVLTRGSAIATTHPILPLPPLEDARIAGAIVTLPTGDPSTEPRAIAVYSAHLPEGGGPDSSQDTARIRQAELIAAQLDRLRSGSLGEAFEPYANAPAILAGTLNITGSELPRITLEESAELRFAELPHMLTDQLDTWHDHASNLPPATLDHMAFTPGIDIALGFVVNVRRLGPVLARQSGMHRADFEATPHMMLIADCTFDSEPTSARD